MFSQAHTTLGICARREFRAFVADVPEFRSGVFSDATPWWSPLAQAMPLRQGIAARWELLVLAAALLLLALLYNRFARERRHRLRRVLYVFGLYAVAAVAGPLTRWVGLAHWPERLTIATDLLEAFTLIGILGLALFDLVLVRARMAPPQIVPDITIGIAYVVATIGVARGAGVNLASIIATSAALSAVIALSLQQTLGNVIGGVALQLDGSIKVGDWIQLENGRQGRVKHIRWRHTTLETRDWGTLVVPNALLLGSQFMIMGRREGFAEKHRFHVQLNVDHRHSPERVVNVIDDALRGAPIPHVASEPPPHAVCLDLTDLGRSSALLYEARYWLTDLGVDETTNSAVRTRVVAALARAGIPLALPEHRVTLDPDAARHAMRSRELYADGRRRALRSVALFAQLTDAEIDSLVDHLREAPFARSEFVLQQGAVAHSLYILTAGSVQVRVGSRGTDSKTVTIISAPDYFGEMGMMTGEPRAADVVALSAVECFKLEKDALERILRARPEIAAEISRTLAERRAGLLAAQQAFDERQQIEAQRSEQQRILGNIRSFFGLAGT